MVAEVDTRREHITFTPFPDAGAALEYRADGPGAEEEIRIVAGGRATEVRRDPRGSFPPYGPEGWDALQVGYFVSVATWNYLTEPFLFARPDVVATEIEPWTEGTQTWRRLAVTFPAALPNHNPDQIFYFDDRFLLRRMDYLPDVTGAAIAHYTHDPVECDGLVFYARRLVHPRGPDGVADQTRTAISIRTDGIDVQR